MKSPALIPSMGRLLEDPSLRNRQRVFQDRTDAGRRLAAFIREHLVLDRPLICAIPAGGVPVGVQLAVAFPASVTRYVTVLMPLAKVKLPIWLIPLSGEAALVAPLIIQLRDTMLLSASAGVEFNPEVRVAKQLP